MSLCAGHVILKQLTDSSVDLSAALLAQITGGRLSGEGNTRFSNVITDSRSSGIAGGSLFIALKGLNHDGHSFIYPLYGRGVRVFLVERLPEEAERMSGAAFVITYDTICGLQKLASWTRDCFHGRVIAVTGSAGKTIVKEWLAGVMSATGSVIRSPRSYNSQVGVPLSLLKLNDRYDIAVIEAGISRPGEMARLASLIKPDTVVVTNIGEAHGENFSGKDETASEKLLLAKDANTIVFNADERLISAKTDEMLPGVRCFTWSLTGTEADLVVHASPAPEGGKRLDCQYGGAKFRVEIPFADRASEENICSVIACSLSEGVDPESIADCVPSLPAVAMRMEIKKGINNCTLIEDYYNSDPGSLGMALDFLSSHSRGKRTLILSDFRQIGGDETTLYSSVARVIAGAGVDRFIAIGETLSRHRSLFPDHSLFYGSTADFTETFRSSAFSDETILLKGARAFGFERISALMERQLHQTRLEINMNSVVHNLNQFRRLLNPGTGIMAMVKAFAYGAGSAEIASLLEYNNVGYFAVAYADEGVALREAGITAPVMVMNPGPGVMELMIRHDLEPELYSMESYNDFLSAAGRYGVLHYPVHLKIDTGMHRLGFSPDEAELLASWLKREERLKVISVFSHLAASEDPCYDDFTRRQAERLEASAGIISDALGYKVKKHLLNSSGVPRFPQYQYDMVRLGIGLYGIGCFEGMKLKTTGRFLTAVSQVRTVAAGEPVSYGCNDASDHVRQVAVIPVGYADGLRRSQGNGRGHIFIAGRKVPLTGNICMDMCMADVTGLGVKAGDEAEIFGEHIPIEELAVVCDTIPYEILTSIPPRVKRVYINE